jgi:nicotinamide/nicotinate riboside kinase
MILTLPGFDIKSWDSPGAIDWVQVQKVLQDAKCTGSISFSHVSGYDEGDIPIDDNRAVAWKARFEDVEQHYLVSASVKATLSVCYPSAGHPHFLAFPQRRTAETA